MKQLPEFFYLLINYPALIAAPIIFFAALALWSHSRTAWVATTAWVVYLAYELGMHAGVFCSGEACMKRSPLYFVYPLLAFLSVVALVQVYVHIRDKRNKAYDRGLSTHHARPTMETQYGDDRRTAGSRSECAAVLVELEAAIAGAQALFDSDVAAGLSVSVEAQNGRRLLDQAMGRVEELRGLIEPE